MKAVPHVPMTHVSLTRLSVWLFLWVVEKVYGVSVSVRGYKLLVADEVIVKSKDYELVGLHVCSHVSRDSHHLFR